MNDDEAYKKWIERPNLTHDSDTQSAWHAALAYRDAQNKEDLNELLVTIPTGYKSSILNEAPYDRLRKRCGLK